MMFNVMYLYFQSHINGVEYELPRLLNKILEEPSLGQYLIPHFSPENVGTANLLLMYSTISDKICQKCDVNYALLAKVRCVLVFMITLQ